MTEQPQEGWLEVPRMTKEGLEDLVKEVQRSIERVGNSPVHQLILRLAGEIRLLHGDLDRLADQKG